MKKIGKGLILVVIVMTIVCIYRQRYLSVNEELHSAPVKSYNVGEEVVMEDDILMDFTMEGYTISVNEADIMTYEEFLKKYQVEDVYTYVPDKVYDVSVTLKNINADDTTGVNMSSFYIQGLAVCASMDTNLYDQANPEVEGVYSIALRKGTEMEFHLPFGLWEDSFRTKIWNDLENFKMDFVATLYPVKKVISLEDV